MRVVCNSGVIVRTPYSPQPGTVGAGGWVPDSSHLFEGKDEEDTGNTSLLFTHSLKKRGQSARSPSLSRAPLETKRDQPNADFTSSPDPAVSVTLAASPAVADSDGTANVTGPTG